MTGTDHMMEMTQTILPDRQRTKTTGSFVAVRGTAVRGSSAPSTGAGTIRGTGTAASAFVALSRSDRTDKDENR